VPTSFEEARNKVLDDWSATLTKNRNGRFARDPGSIAECPTSESDLRKGVAGELRKALLVSQRDYGVDAHRAARGNVARSQGNDE